MPKKTIIIFITTFVLVGIIILGVFFWMNKDKGTGDTTETTPWYQSFNPFGTGSDVAIGPDGEIPTEGQLPGEETPGTSVSRFYQITDFAVAGATFLDDTRPVVVDPNAEVVPQQEIIKTVISANTKDGRKEIQKILNETLSLNPPLVVDGAFGKKVTDAVKEFQTLNNLTVTGIIDTETAPYFTKSTTVENVNPAEKTEEAPSIRYVERANGHIYKMFLDTQSKEKISNSTIPNIYEAIFDGTGKTVVYRYLSENKMIDTFVATLGAPKGEFLPQNIFDFSISPNKTQFFYLTGNSNGSAGTLGSFGSTKKEMVFNSPFTEWLSQIDNNQRIYLTNKASYVANGSIFLLNASSKTTTKIMGGIPGLTTLVNRNGSLVLYSISTATGPKLEIFNINNHTNTDLDKYGLPEKCVWSIDSISVYCGIPNLVVGNQYPDSWYQGLTSFTDYFIKINIVNGEWETIANSREETPIDATHLFLDKTESNLFFINKKDSSLWGLKLK